MAQSYKIFINDAPLFIASKTDASQYQPLAPVSEDWGQNLPAVVASLYEQAAGKGWILVTDSPDAFMAHLKQQLPVVVAAGGMVWNSHDDLLMIFRRGKWDLPKGKLDPGESPEQAALREVNEETGATGLDITGKIEIMYYIFKDHGQYCLKEIHWYNMACSSSQPLKPQTKEDISLAEWISRDQIAEKMENTYGSIRGLVKGNVGN